MLTYEGWLLRPVQRALNCSSVVIRHAQSVKSKSSRQRTHTRMESESSAQRA
jgi:hypothetical protein